MKNTLNGIYSRLDTAEDKISELVTVRETIYKETRRKKG